MSFLENCIPDGKMDGTNCREIWLQAGSSRAAIEVNKFTDRKVEADLIRAQVVMLASRGVPAVGVKGHPIGAKPVVCRQKAAGIQTVSSAALESGPYQLGWICTGR